MKKTLLVFTGGGLAATLNATLYGVISEAQKKGYRVLGGLEGWKSLLTKGKVFDLTEVNVDVLKDRGGTFLLSSRTNPLKEEGGLSQIKSRVKELKLDALVSIGGNDTLGAAQEVSKELEIPVVGIPKTVDNDFSGTYWTPGFPTAATKINSIVQQIKEDAAHALKRIFLVETIGMKAGWIPAASYLANPDLIVVPEKKVSLDSFLALLKKKYKENGNYATVVIAEEVRFDRGIKGISDNQEDKYTKVSRQNFISIALREKIKEELGIYSQVVIPRNLLQSGPPVKIDQEFAIKLGQHAVNLIEEKKTGIMSGIVRPNEAKKKFEVSAVSLDQAVGEKNLRTLDDSWFRFQEFMVTDKLKEYIESFIEMPIRGKEYQDLVKKILRI